MGDAPFVIGPPDVDHSVEACNAWLQRDGECGVWFKTSVAGEHYLVIGGKVVLTRQIAPNEVGEWVKLRGSTQE
jgi:hypothetical protein